MAFTLVKPGICASQRAGGHQCPATISLPLEGQRVLQTHCNGVGAVRIEHEHSLKECSRTRKSQTRVNMRNRFGIRKGEKVLDVGCGAHPFYLATHLADKSLTDNSERFGPIPPTHLPLYECSVESMPFNDAEFD